MAGEHRRAKAVCFSSDVPGERRLPDPRLAAEEDQTTFAGERAIKLLLEKDAFPLSPNEERAMP
jgi:hypothetical protein